MLTAAMLLVAPGLGLAAAEQQPTPVPQPAPTQERSQCRERVCAEEAAGAASTGSSSPSEDSAEQTVIDGKRTTATPVQRPPLLDGVVDEAVWDRADVVTDFLQRDPDAGERSSERTEVRILYDEEHLYFGFVMHDDPDDVLATDLRRDSGMGSDDTVEVILDTFHDHRNGFLFRVNPLGTKYDAQVRDERDTNSRWDEKWEAAARVTERGWEAELAIPWKVLRFRAGSHLWGIDFRRQIRRDNEEVAWSNYRRGYRFQAVSQAGHLVGLRGLKLTDRFRFKPYVSGGWATLLDTELEARSGDGQAEIGVEDFKVQITPNLTADLTLNTDFAEVEDDNERVNLTRFPLFFPERREFFLESADAFSFGSGGGPGPPLALLFHSRRIGLVDGEPVPMSYGVKLAGKVGGSSIGVINAGAGDTEDAAGSNSTAVRWKQDVLSRSSVGAIFTNVQGPDGAYNRVGGVDASFRFFEYLGVSGYVAQAHDDELDSPARAAALSAGWNSDLWSANVDYDHIGEDFRTELGFIRRTDIRRQEASVGWKPRPSVPWLRRIVNFASVEYITDTAGELESRRQSLWSSFDFESGDQIGVNVGDNFERLDSSFDVAEQATVPAGDHEFVDWRAWVRSYRGRRLSGRVSVGGGGWYHGKRFGVGADGTLRVNENLSLSPGVDFNEITLPDTQFNTYTARMRASYNFDERWLTSALAQYNSVSEQLSLFARLNFIYRTGDDVFLVLKQTTRYDDPFHDESDRQVIAKMTRSFDW